MNAPTRIPPGSSLWLALLVTLCTCGEAASARRIETPRFRSERRYEAAGPMPLWVVHDGLTGRDYLVVYHTGIVELRR